MNKFEKFLPVDHRHHLRHWAEAVEESGDHGHDRPVRPPGIVGVTLEDLVDDEVAGEEGGVAVEDVAQQILLRRKIGHSETKMQAKGARDHTYVTSALGGWAGVDPKPNDSTDRTDRLRECDSDKGSIIPNILWSSFR